MEMEEEQEIEEKPKRFKRVYAQGRVKDYTGTGVMLLLLAVFLPPIGLVMSFYHILKVQGIEDRTGKAQKGVFLLYIALALGILMNCALIVPSVSFNF